MNKLLNGLLFVAAIPAIYLIQSSDVSDSPPSTAVVKSSLPAPGEEYQFRGNGKTKSDILLEELYTPTSLSEFQQENILAEDMVKGLKKQLRVIRNYRKRNKQAFGSLNVDYILLEKSIKDLLKFAETENGTFQDQFDAFQIKGEDGKGNVRFTGYFTPVLPVSDKKCSVYKYPIYTRPTRWSGKLPSRKEIEGDQVLAGMGLEIAYAKNLVDIYFMQVQGSGIVQFTDGRKQLFSHNGSNGHSYASIGKYMVEHGYTTADKVSLKSIRKFFDRNPDLLHEILFQNPSYIFFSPSDSNPIGSAMVPLTPDYSIAVDTRYIPMGSCLLAKVPVIKKNKTIRHEYRLLLAQDIGGAIKGPGHVDLYMGIGDHARQKASALHHYGNLWLVLSKHQPQLASN